MASPARFAAIAAGSLILASITPSQPAAAAPFELDAAIGFVGAAAAASWAGAAPGPRYGWYDTDPSRIHESHRPPPWQVRDDKS